MAHIGNLVFDAGGDGLAFDEPAAGIKWQRYFGDTFAFSPSDLAKENVSLAGRSILTPASGTLVAADDSYTLRPNVALTVDAAHGLLANDTNSSGAPFVELSSSDPAHGTLSVASGGSFVYTPSAGYFGTDTFTYTVGDGTYMASATVTLNVVDAAPVANPDFYTVHAGKVLTVAAPGFLANDSDPDGDPIEASSFFDPAHGTLTNVVANGSFTYTPAAGYVGTDTFTYFMDDGVLGASAQVTIQVVDRAPVATNDTYAVTPNGSLNVTALHGLLANDTDPDGDAIEAQSFGTPSHGTLHALTDGSFQYTPLVGYIGADTVTYTISDGTLTSSAQVTFVVGATSPNPFILTTGTDQVFYATGSNTVDGTSATLNPSDSLEGGTGTDTLALTGGGTFNLGAVSRFTGFEIISLGLGASYSLTMGDADVATGQVLTIDASALGANSLTFNGSAEMDGKFAVLAGAGADTLTGGVGADTFTFTAANLTAADTINGGTGASLDRIALTTAGTIAAAAFQNVSHIEQLLLANGSNNITLADAMVGASDNSHILTVSGGTGDDTVNASALTAANRAYIIAGAGNDTLTGGAGLDIFYFTAADLTSGDTVNGGAGASLDVLAFTTAGTVAATAFQNVSHVEEVFLATGTNNVTLTDALVGSSDNNHLLYVSDSTGTDTVDASAVTTATNRIDFFSGAGSDTLTGGAGADIFYFAPGNLTAADSVNGGTGASIDSIIFTAATGVAASAFQNVTHIEQIVLAPTGTNFVMLTDSLVGGADDNHVLYVDGGAGNDTVDASAVTTVANRVFFTAGGGNDTLTGGAGGDTFYFTAANLTSADTVNGGTGASVDRIVFTTAGTIGASAFQNVTHVEQLYLANGANNTALTDALVGGADDNHQFYVTGGTGADTVNGSAVTSVANKIVFNGGGGADVLTAGAGADTFVYAAASDSTSTGYDTITGFSFAADRFDIPGGAGTITLVESARSGALDSGASFDTELAARFSTLAGHHAGLLTVTSGSLSGQTFLVVDLNGTAGYQTGADLVIHLVSSTGTPTIADFI